ncbi:low affinity iron permease family protein [Sinorhizobium saheli]|jgi:low affinity Fe/Cu permease|uniref:Iron permease n=1 Tax=Sinorhizobium saheli TaxID=36856 RepID=A0A178YQI7_SINSA|nr:low affinity iron permease family protein [Sinorhizobium saheli]MQW88929.1 low affinity iron permease family protein [Sinorhizobium saheli]OAP49476.1 iron permease [Sinorhizobium saheli]
MSQTIDKFNQFATSVAAYAGRPTTFAIALAVVVLWGLSGPLFDFSETWQLVINTGTTIVTFLMVFVLQNSQNRNDAALQAKLDELILTSSAENSYIGIQDLDERELKRLTELLKEHAEDEGDQALHRKVSRAAGRHSKKPRGKAKERRERAASG